MTEPTKCRVVVEGKVCGKPVKFSPTTERWYHCLFSIPIPHKAMPERRNPNVIGDNGRTGPKDRRSKNA